MKLNTIGRIAEAIEIIAEETDATLGCIIDALNGIISEEEAKQLEHYFFE